MTSVRTAALRPTVMGNFAHLLGIGAKGRPAVEEEPKSPPEDDDSGAKTGSAEPEKKDPEAVEPKAEDCEECDGTGMNDDDEPCEACDGTGEKPAEGKKGKKAKKAETDEECAEESDEDEDVRKAAKAGRRFDRARCKAIFSAKAAGVRPDMAAQLAFGTRLSAKAAIGLLNEAANVAPTQGRQAAARPRFDLTTGPAPAAGANLAQRILAAGAKRRGEKPKD